MKTALEKEILMVPHTLSQEPSTKTARILVVEDNPITRRGLTRMLEAGGYRASSACNGRQALAMIEAEVPDLVVLDLHMPVMDGFETCRALRQQASTRMLPIIMLTAAEELEARVRSYDLDADDVLVKPVYPQELFARIKSLQRLRQLREQSYREMEQRVMLECELQLARARHEEEKRHAQLYGEVVKAVTGGRLRMLGREEMDRLLDGLAWQPGLRLQDPASVNASRGLALEFGVENGLAQERAEELALCVAEAGANVIKHAGSGWLDLSGDQDFLYVLVTDGGPGFRFEDLTLCTLVKGFSTKASMGMGFALMLELCDAVYLQTSPGHTRIVLQLARQVEEPSLDDLLETFAAEW